MVGLEHKNVKKGILLGYFPRRKITINVGKNLRPLSYCNADIVSSNAFSFAFISYKLSSSFWCYPLWRIISDVQWGLLYKYSLLRFSLGMLHFEPVLEKWSQNNRVRIKFCVYSHESAFPSPLFLTLWIWPRNAQYYVMKSREGTWTYISS